MFMECWNVGIFCSPSRQPNLRHSTWLRLVLVRADEVLCSLHYILTPYCLLRRPAAPGNSQRSWTNSKGSQKEDGIHQATLPSRAKHGSRISREWQRARNTIRTKRSSTMSRDRWHRLEIVSSRNIRICVTWLTDDQSLLFWPPSEAFRILRTERFLFDSQPRKYRITSRRERWSGCTCASS